MLSVAKRHGLIEASIGDYNYTWRATLSVAKRHGLIEASLVIVLFIVIICYPWQNATASLKQIIFHLFSPFYFVIRGKTPRPH